RSPGCHDRRPAGRPGRHPVRDRGPPAGPCPCPVRAFLWPSGRRDQRRLAGWAGGRSRRAGRIGADVVAGAARPPGGAAARAGGAGRAVVDRVDAERVGSLATAEFSPPPELTPAQGGIVLAEAVGENQKVAWLIGAAADGYLDIEQAGQEVTLVRRSGQDESPVSRTLDTLFCGRDRLTLGAYDPSFAAAWQEIGDELEAWRRTSGLWDAAGDLYRKLAWVLGALSRRAAWSSPSWAAPQPAGRAGCGWRWQRGAGCWPELAWLR